MFEDDRGMEALDRELADLGPLMVEQERLEAQPPDPVFAAQLRARLADLATQTAPAPAPPDQPRRRLGLFPRLRSMRWAGLGGAALVAAAAILFLLLRSPEKTTLPVPSATWLPPTPSSGDLTKSYPVYGGLGGGGMANPTVSRIEYPVGGPYPNRIHLSAGKLPAVPSAVTAYQLRGSSFDAPRIATLARLLGIPGPVKRMSGYEWLGGTQKQTSWVTIARDGGQFHSVAVSLRTGRLIYHDFGADPGYPNPLPAPDRASAIAASRTWLTRLGWPGASMPLMETLYATGGPGIASISFGWPGAGPADLPAATVNVAHGGRVDEALLLPPVGSSRTLTSLPLATVWQRLQAGKVPIGVENMIAAQFPPGTGTVQGVTVAHVLTAGANKRLFLVPTFRFYGSVRFPHVAGPRRWFALAPAISR